MDKYWISPVLLDSTYPKVQYGCYVFERGRDRAICRAYGSCAAEAHAQAHIIIAALLAVEQRPAVAAKARHYIVRSPVHDEVAVHCGEETTLNLAYEAYYDECERAQKNPKSFDEWKAARHD